MDQKKQRFLDSNSNDLRSRVLCVPEKKNYGMMMLNSGASLGQKLGLSSQMKLFRLGLHFPFESWVLQYVVSCPQGISPFALKKSV